SPELYTLSLHDALPIYVTSHVSDPLPAAVGLAVIDVIEQEGLVEQARRRGEYLLARLRELQQRHVHIGDVRGKGLLVVVPVRPRSEEHTSELQSRENLV